jgi:hypothetical protein
VDTALARCREDTRTIRKSAIHGRRRGGARHGQQPAARGPRRSARGDVADLQADARARRAGAQGGAGTQGPTASARAGARACRGGRRRRRGRLTAYSIRSTPTLDLITATNVGSRRWGTPLSTTLGQLAQLCPTPDSLQNTSKCGLWGKAHGSIRIQEGEPSPNSTFDFLSLFFPFSQLAQG